MKYLGKESLSSVLQVGLNVVWYISILSLVGLVIAMLFIGFRSPDIISQSSHFSLEVSGLKFTFEDPLTPSVNKTWLLLMLGGGAFPAALVATFAVHQLRRIFATFAEKKPFAQENVGRIRWIGVAVLGWAVLQRVGSLGAAYYIMQNVRIPGIHLDVNLMPNLPMIFVGLVILVMAEVFRIGADLQEDHDLTI